MKGYRLTSICNSQWDMIIFVNLNIISKLYSKDIKSPFTVKNLTEYNLLTLNKYILPLFGVNKHNNTQVETIQSRINTLYREKFINRIPRQEFRKIALIPPCFLHNSRLLPPLFL